MSIFDQANKSMVIKDKEFGSFPAIDKKFVKQSLVTLVLTLDLSIMKPLFMDMYKTLYPWAPHHQFHCLSSLCY